MKLKFVGFDKSIDMGIRSAKHFIDLLTPIPNDKIERERLINYLRQGIFLTGAMTFIYDDEKKPIGNLDYFTDGEFVWPRYYLYYLEKYNNFYLDQTLYNYASNNGFAIAKISNEQMQLLEREFDFEWGMGYKK